MSFTLLKIIDTHQGLPVTAVAVVPDGGRVISLTDKVIKLWGECEPDDSVLAGSGTSDRTLFEDIGKWPGLGEIAALLMTPDGEQFVTGHSNRQSNQIQVWSTSDPTLPPVQAMTVTRGSLGCAKAFAITPNGDILISGGSGGRLCVWDLSTHELIESMVGEGSIVALCVTADGARVAAGTLKGPIYMWDLVTFSRLGMLRGHGDMVTELAACSHDASVVVSSSLDGTVRVWNSTSMALVCALTEFGTGAVHAVKISPDGSHIIAGGAGSAGGQAIVWDAATFNPLAVLECDREVTCLAMSGSYDLVVMGTSRGKVFVWEGPGIIMPK